MSSPDKHDWNDLSLTQREVLWRAFSREEALASPNAACPPNPYRATGPKARACQALRAKGLITTSLPRESGVYVHTTEAGRKLIKTVPLRSIERMLGAHRGL